MPAIQVTFTEAEARSLVQTSEFVKDLFDDGFEAMGIQSLCACGRSARESAVEKLTAGLVQLQAAESARMN